MEPNMPNKKIPNCITKEQLIKIYHPLPSKIIIDSVNPIIVVNRKKIPAFSNKTDTNLRKARYVFKEEFLLLIEILGIPDGYEI